jgi:hypothetical protein
MVPFVGGIADSFVADGHGDPIESGLEVPSPGYLTALGFRLRAGRFFTHADDAGAAPVAIVSASFARKAWNTLDVVGRSISPEPITPKTPPITVVGVVDDIRRTSLEATPPPVVFIPMDQSTIGTSTNFVLRTSGDPHDAIPDVRAIAKSLDGNVAVTRVATMDERVAKLIAPRLFNVWLGGVFAAIAFVLAVVGLYGLVSEAVARRTQEIGLRMALGATPRAVIGLVVGGSVTTTALGLLLGLAAAAIVARSLGSMLFGVTPLDPMVLAVAPLVFAGAAGCAAALPARRATRVDPIITLRSE